MQNEQRLLHPSCTFKLGRVFCDTVAGEDRCGNQFSVGKDVADESERRARECDRFKRNKILLLKPIHSMLAKAMAP